MPAIRIPKENWGKVWHALLDIGEIHRIPPEDEKVYIVSDKHIELENVKIGGMESFNEERDNIV
jgi:hypothetical protein